MHSNLKFQLYIFFTATANLVLVTSVMLKGSPLPWFTEMIVSLKRLVLKA